VRYVTHEFAHPETLDRARRWLIQVGFDATRIETRAQGIPRLAVAVGPGEAAEVAMLIDTAEASDPDGYPYFMEYTRHRPADPRAETPEAEAKEAARWGSFVMSWRPLDRDRGTDAASREVELQAAYQERGE
jgi:hypothetical protein